MLVELPMHVAVCALTFHRPEGLRSLLDGLHRLEVPEGVTVSIVVVDNDEVGSGKNVVEAIRQTLGFPLTYVIESRRGIAQGRNTAVSTALSVNADFVAFIDDDEIPEANWLVDLIDVQTSTGADVVTGPVVPVFDEPPPNWVIRGAFYERPRFATGTRMTYARTSNVLIDISLLRDPWPPFDERYATTGGEDTHFFMRARLDGAHIVWSDEAVVKELVPTSRISMRWLVRRSYRRGNTLSLCLRDLQDSWPRRAKRVGASVFHMVSGVALLISSVFGGTTAWVKGMQKVAYAAGLATGLFGSTFEEYAQTHGR